MFFGPLICFYLQILVDFENKLNPTLEKGLKGAVLAGFSFALSQFVMFAVYGQKWNLIIFQFLMQCCNCGQVWLSTMDLGL